MLWALRNMVFLLLYLLNILLSLASSGTNYLQDHRTNMKATSAVEAVLTPAVEVSSSMMKRETIRLHRQRIAEAGQVTMRLTRVKVF
jgi:hypothetical protein